MSEDINNKKLNLGVIFIMLFNISFVINFYILSFFITKCFNEYVKNEMQKSKCVIN